ncbi:MAG: NAD(P)/FAD-dependent oxidoreductase, partial [Myxococcales bacterium]|nr:NAD(P)/FAD-dependent oxidoreductase [Myxococcales bacterium]
GAGPNGLVAAALLGRAGLDVLVLEANYERAGGALGSEAATLPGFVHDVGAAFFPFAKASPAFKDLDLEGAGVRWLTAPIESCHPAPDGSVAIISRDHDVTAQHFGSPRDGDAWRRLATWHAKVEASILGFLLRPLPTIAPLLRLLPFDIFRLLRILMSSGGGLSERLFRSVAARRVLPGLALHVDLGPDDTFSAALGYMLGLTATTGGYCIPEGGAQAITDALVRMIEGYGGRVRLGAPVAKIRAADGRAQAVVLASGEEIRAKKAILANTAAPTLLLELVDRKLIPGRVVRKMESFVQGWGTFKVDWALDAPVPWSSELARQSAVVHAGDSLDDLRRFTDQVRGGDLPDNPYLVIGQQSLTDPTRAPEGKHTLWAYSRVPPQVAKEGGWAAAAERFADVVDARIEGLAPGFKKTVLQRRVVAPPDLEAMDANLIGGDLGGGSNAWHRQLVFRPLFPYFRYRMPLRGLYLCSSYAHPGAGVHGMCGYNAASIALRDIA